MYAEILTIGDELCRGEIVDTNSTGLAAKLWDAQITPRWLTSCRDDVLDMQAGLRLATSRADLVICSGGLGPTEDDLTVDTVAGLAGVEVTWDQAAEAVLRAKFGARVPPVAVTELQRRQVRVPVGATVFANPAGLAPGFAILVNGVPVVCLPGVPREVWGIYETGVAAYLADLRAQHGAAPAIARLVFRVFGQGETQISAACRGLVDGHDGASIHYQVKFPEVLVKLVVKRPSMAEANAVLSQLREGLYQRLGKHVYGEGDENLPALVCRTLRQRPQLVATAESCTGGLLAQMLTEPAGSSAYFAGAAVCYTNQEKTRALGVPAAIFETDGAVSEACVRAMARGAVERFGVDLAVAISGIAGPSGGTPEKPVGTVHVACAVKRGEQLTVTHRNFCMPFARDMVRALAAWTAFAMLWQALQEPATA